VSPEDIRWMLELTAPRIKAAMKFREKYLELTEKILTKTNNIILKALGEREHLTREEILSHILKARIRTDENRSSHILLRAELDGIICSGISKGNKRTYTLLEKRVPVTKRLNKDEALAKLAKKYFLSHCPATLQDFIWWSGLSVTNAKHALEMVKSNFIPEKIDSQTYWLSNSFSVPVKNNNACHLLPAYDEFMISYKDRNASLNFEHHSKSISANGIFRPVIVVNGQVKGLWKRSITDNIVIVEPDFFHPFKKTELSLVKKASQKLGVFFEKKAELRLANNF
jgi:hypothetical protein